MESAARCTTQQTQQFRAHEENPECIRYFSTVGLGTESGETAYGARSLELWIGGTGGFSSWLAFAAARAKEPQNRGCGVWLPLSSIRGFVVLLVFRLACGLDGPGAIWAVCLRLQHEMVQLPSHSTARSVILSALQSTSFCTRRQGDRERWSTWARSKYAQGCRHQVTSVAVISHRDLAAPIQPQPLPYRVSLQ